MIDEVNTPEWAAWQEATYNLEQLEKFHAEWNAPDKKIEEIWKSYRLLPLQPAYLIASHYRYHRWGWSVTTKWNLYVQFETALSNQENSAKISSSIVSAVQTQRKIVALQKIFATLKDRTKTAEDKTRVYQELKQENQHLYQEIAHKISVAKDRFIYPDKATRRPKEGYTQAVIRKMLFLYNEGHPTLDDHFFIDLSH